MTKLLMLADVGGRCPTPQKTERRPLSPSAQKPWMAGALSLLLADLFWWWWLVVVLLRMVTNAAVVATAPAGKSPPGAVRSTSPVEKDRTTATLGWE